MIEIFNLDARKVKILEHLADGLTSEQIGEKMYSSKRTIEGIKETLIRTFEAKNTVQLIAMCIRYGIIK